MVKSTKFMMSTTDEMYEMLIKETEARHLKSVQETVRQILSESLRK